MSLNINEWLPSHSGNVDMSSYPTNRVNKPFIIQGQQHGRSLRRIDPIPLYDDGDLYIFKQTTKPGAVTCIHPRKMTACNMVLSVCGMQVDGSLLIRIQKDRWRDYRKTREYLSLAFPNITKEKWEVSGLDYEVRLKDRKSLMIWKLSYES